MRYTQDQVDQIVSNLERSITDPETGEINFDGVRADIVTEDVACARNALAKVFRDYSYAIDDIASLRAQLDGARSGTKGCMAGVTGTSVDPERPSCLRVHFDHPVTDSDRERIRNAHNTVVRLASELDEARRKAIEECAAIAEACDMRLLEYPNDTARTHYESAVMDASMSIATIIRTLLSESKSC